jgi:hypothetical protein
MGVMPAHAVPAHAGHVGSLPNEIKRGSMKSSPPYAPPLRIRKSGESFAVEDANGVALAYVYFEEHPSRRGLVNRLSGADAKVVAQKIARALTEAAGGSAR